MTVANSTDSKAKQNLEIKSPMHCLNPTEQKEWLTRSGQVEDPYREGAPSSGKLYRQFYTPPRLSQIEAFVAHYLDAWESGEALLVVTDWPLYSPYEMKLIDLARLAHGEKRRLIDASGHLFPLDEKDDLVSLFSLTVAYYWSAYLYLPSAKTTLHNWEGEIFDFWTDDSQKYTTLLELQKSFRLNRTGLMSAKFYWLGKKAMWRFNRLIKVRRS
jgi:hypothetical protein